MTRSPAWPLPVWAHGVMHPHHLGSRSPPKTSASGQLSQLFQIVESFQLLGIESSLLLLRLLLNLSVSISSSVKLCVGGSIVRIRGDLYGVPKIGAMNTIVNQGIMLGAMEGVGEHALSSQYFLDG